MDQSEAPGNLSLEERAKQLDRYPGTLADYNTLKGAEHVLMDTGTPYKFVFVDSRWLVSPSCFPKYPDLNRNLLDQGCVGVIHYVPQQQTQVGRTLSIGGYGIPVRRK